jgi:hypothetical membrane protein
MLDLKTNNIIHIFVQGLLLVLIGFYKEKTHKLIFYLLGLVTLLIPVYVPLPNLSLTYWNMISVVHYIGIMPLLLYISYKQKLTKNSYDVILFVGIFIIFYHSYKYYSRIKNETET